MRTVRISFRFSGISEQFGYNRVICHCHNLIKGRSIVLNMLREIKKPFNLLNRLYKRFVSINLFLKDRDVRIASKEILHNHYSEIVVEGYIDNKRVGYSIWSIYCEDAYAYLKYIEVTPKHRRKGIGSRIFDEGEKMLKRKNINTLYTDVSSDNVPIIGLLEKKDFVVDKQWANSLEYKKILFDS